MKLTATTKLMPTNEQRQTLLQTLERANAACQSISAVAWANKTFNRVRLHHLTYYPVREEFGLTAQMAVRVIGKVSDAYKKDKKTKRAFHKHGAVPYDSRILTWDIGNQMVSIWTLDGREPIPFVCGEHQQKLLPFQQGESDLVYRDGTFYLFTTCDVPDDKMIDPADYLGIDLGIKNIAVSSDGTIHSAKHLLNVRHRHRRLRKKLQAKGTKSAKRKLKQLSGKEARFARNVNHGISKQIVKSAKDT
ncbi:MAG: transposase, partial [Armatimonadetes bacterium]|nr:transposase [Anaerolineae bacterium]